MDQKESCALANKLNLKKSINTQESTYTRLGKKESTIDYIMTSKETNLNKAVNITSNQKIQQNKWQKLGRCDVHEEKNN